MTHEAGNERRLRIPSPTTWPGLAFEVVRRPDLRAWCASLLLAGYLVSRVLGFDPLARPLEKMGIRASTRDIVVPQISGDWEYRCTSSRDGTLWGGTAYISLVGTASGVLIHVAGERQWKGKRDKSGRVQKQLLDPAVPWDTTEEGSISFGKVRWHYETHPEGGLTKGSAELELVAGEKAGARMTGTFSDQAPGAHWGTFELRRVNGPSDPAW
jgi:hypothetical protein